MSKLRFHEYLDYDGTWQPCNGDYIEAIVKKLRYLSDNYDYFIVQLNNYDKEHVVVRRKN